MMVLTSVVGVAFHVSEGLVRAVCSFQSKYISFFVDCVVVGECNE